MAVLPILRSAVAGIVVVAVPVSFALLGSADVCVTVAEWLIVVAVGPAVSRSVTVGAVPTASVAALHVIDPAPGPHVQGAGALTVEK